MRHLGDRVAPLVDGRMSPAEEERAWTHVHGCPFCTDAVQREGWVKRRLAGLSEAEVLPDELRGSLVDTGSFAAYPTAPLAYADPAPRRRLTGLAALGAGSVSAAMVGVVALGAAPANAPGLDRRAPASITQPQLVGSPAPRPKPGRLLGNLSHLDPGEAARQVAATVGVGMTMGS